MKKIKLLTGLTSVGILAGTIIPLSSCACKSNQEERFIRVIDEYKDVVKVTSEYTKDGDLAIYLACTNDTLYVEFLDRIVIGETTLTSQTDYTFNNSEQTIIIKKATLEKYKGWITIWPQEPVAIPEAGELKGIEVSGAKTKFNIGDSFSYSEATVKAVSIYNGNEIRTNITGRSNVKFEGVDFNTNLAFTTEGEYTVKVTYKTVSTTYKITVADDPTQKEEDFAWNGTYDSYKPTAPQYAGDKVVDKDEANNVYLKDVAGNPKVLVDDILNSLSHNPNFRKMKSNKAKVYDVSVNEPENTNDDYTVNFKVHYEFFGELDETNRDTKYTFLNSDFELENVKFKLTDDALAEGYWTFKIDTNANSKWKIKANFTKNYEIPEEFEEQGIDTFDQEITYESESPEITEFMSRISFNFSPIKTIKSHHMETADFMIFNVIENTLPQGYSLSYFSSAEGGWGNNKIGWNAQTLKIKVVPTDKTTSYFPVVKLYDADDNEMGSGTTGKPVQGDQEINVSVYSEASGDLKIGLELKAASEYKAVSYVDGTGGIFTSADTNPTHLLWDGENWNLSDMKFNVGDDYINKVFNLTATVYKHDGQTELGSATVRKEYGKTSVGFDKDGFEGEVATTNSVIVKFTCEELDFYKVEYDTSELPNGWAFDYYDEESRDRGFTGIPQQAAVKESSEANDDIFNLKISLHCSKEDQYKKFKVDYKIVNTDSKEQVLYDTALDPLFYEDYPIYKYIENKWVTCDEQNWVSMNPTWIDDITSITVIPTVTEIETKPVTYTTDTTDYWWGEESNYAEKNSSGYFVINNTAWLNDEYRDSECTVLVKVYADLGEDPIYAATLDNKIAGDDYYDINLELDEQLVEDVTTLTVEINFEII